MILRCCLEELMILRYAEDDGENHAAAVLRTQIVRGTTVDTEIDAQIQVLRLTENLDLWINFVFRLVLPFPWARHRFHHRETRLAMCAQVDVDTVKTTHRRQAVPNVLPCRPVHQTVNKNPCCLLVLRQKTYRTLGAPSGSKFTSGGPAAKLRRANVIASMAGRKICICRRGGAKQSAGTSMV